MAKKEPKRKAERDRPGRKARRHAQKLSTPSPDLEDLLINMIIRCSTKASNGTDIENLIYSTTPSMSELGYGFGFSVGRSLTLKIGSNSGFPSVLDKIGLHDCLYYPSEKKVIITSRPRQEYKRPHMGQNIHVYESGVISGYLSTHTGIQISTTERRCIYNGSTECQFISTPFSSKQSFQGSGIHGAAYAIAYALKEGRYKKLNEEYYRILAYLPLTDSTISEQILKVMVMAGEKLGALSPNAHIPALVSNIANYFGVKDAKTDRKGIKSIIKLRYESYNSMQAFVAVPAALLSGFALSAGMKSHVDFSTAKDKSYTTIIEIWKKGS